MESRLRVLLVDDEDNLRRLLAKVLRSGGFDVVEFSKSAEAVAWSESNPISVLVTDVTLDGISGSALADAISKQNPDLLVVFISGFPLNIEAESKKHPHCAYLQKPFPPRVLLSTLSALEENRRRGGR